MKKNKPVWLLCLIDLAALGAALMKSLQKSMPCFP